MNPALRTVRPGDHSCESCQNRAGRRRVNSPARYRIPGGYVFELPLVVEYVCAEHAAELPEAVA